jgi:hypothetical protein
MPGWAKGLLITLGIVGVLVVAAIAIGVVYVARNKEAWKAKGREVAAQGKDFGTNTDNQGCVDESILRYKKEPGFLSAMSATLFTRGCFESSRPTPGFCDNVPLGDMMKMADWRDTQCRRYDLANDRNCKPLLFMPVATFCGEQKRKQK